MCLIIVKKSGVGLPTDEMFQCAETANPHGIGVMWWKFGMNDVNIKKDFKDSKELGVWVKKEVGIDDVMVAHFRYATSGLKDEGNRHPFPVTKDKTLLRELNLKVKMGVAHNGVISQYSGDRDQRFSDTQKFTLDILASEAVKNNLNDDAIKKLVIDFIGNDKLAILDAGGVLTLFGNYLEEYGLLFSNGNYKTVRNYAHYTPLWGAKDEYEKYYAERYPSKGLLHDTCGTIGNVTVCEACGEQRAVKSMSFNDGTTYDLCNQCRKDAKREGKKKTGLNTWDCTSCGGRYYEGDPRNFVAGHGGICDGCMSIVKYEDSKVKGGL